MILRLKRVVNPFTVMVIKIRSITESCKFITENSNEYTTNMLTFFHLTDIFPGKPGSTGSSSVCFGREPLDISETWFLHA